MIGVDNSNTAEPIDDATINQEVDALDDFDSNDPYENIGDIEEEVDNIEGDFIAVTEELQQAITELLQRAIGQHGDLDLSHYNIHLGSNRNPGNSQALTNSASDNRENSEIREDSDNREVASNRASEDSIENNDGAEDSSHRDSSDNRYNNDLAADTQDTDNRDLVPDNTAAHPNGDTWYTYERSFSL